MSSLLAPTLKSLSLLPHSGYKYAGKSPLINKLMSHGWFYIKNQSLPFLKVHCLADKALCKCMPKKESHNKAYFGLLPSFSPFPYHITLCLASAVTEAMVLSFTGFIFRNENIILPSKSDSIFAEENKTPEKF